MKLEEDKKCSLMNMPSVDGSNGSKLNNKFGTMCSEFKSRNQALIDFWEIEHYLPGSELLKVVFCISPHTPTLT